MAHTSSISDDIDMDDCSSKSGSNLSLSVGYFPCEDIYCDEDKTSCEDISSNSSSIHFLPPIQGTWRTENIRRPIGRRDQIPDNPEQFCKLSIALAWDVDVDSNNANSIDNWDLNGSSHWIDKYPEEKTELTVSKLDDLVQKLETFLENQKDDKDDESVFPQSTEEEDHQPPGSSPQDTAQVSHQEHIYQDPPKFEPADNEDITKSPQIPSRLKGHEFAELINQATSSQRISTVNTFSVLSGQPEEEDTPPDTQALSCLNLSWVFRWVRQQVQSSLLRRDRTEKATKSPGRPAHKKRCSNRSKKIQPQESFELGHPVSLDF
ncbi:uncharacterized protein C12orf71 homolog [Tupaia chinensis]|uniref:uncharacterized protein C12orf71 homolog n=1 Tax=Tupaia chinensis TaxID=246437 RepID=UPI0003C9178A|nr:uncharacterized protein C12orf71 homolog [Tupaia chinensis]XP_006140321.1 uncharacterized protein C12orf71 homolog [Tupaia chinensis]